MGSAPGRWLGLISGEGGVRRLELLGEAACLTSESLYLVCHRSTSPLPLFPSVLHRMRATIVLFEIKHQNGRQRRVRGKKIMRKTSQPPAVLFLVPVSSCPSLCLWGLPGGGRSHSGPLPRMATERPLPSRWLESNGLIQGPLTLRSSPRKPGGTQLGCVQL